MILGLVQRLENSGFILEIKMVELNQDKKFKPHNWRDADWKLVFTIK